MGFPDESEYQGGTTSGELIHGIFAFSNHEVYDGEWRDNKLEGRGTVSDDHRLRREENPRDEFRGTHYAGEWKQNRFDGEGSYTWASGSSYTGQWKEGKKHGKGKYTFANGNMDLVCFEANRPVGQAVRWSADRAQAWELQDGKQGRSISLEEAAQIAARIGLPVP